RPELTAYARALEARAVRVAAVEDERVAHVRGIERDETSGALTVVSEFVPGSRLCDLIEAAASQPRDENAPPSVDVALGFLLEAWPGVGSLPSGMGLTQGAAAAGRMIVTPAGRVVLCDAIFGEALERARFTRTRLWTHFRIALPTDAARPRFDIALDLAQAT